MKNTQFNYLYHYKLPNDGTYQLQTNPNFVPKERSHLEHKGQRLFLEGDFNVDLKALLSSAKDMSHNVEKYPKTPNMKDIFLASIQEAIEEKIKEIGNLKKLDLVQDKFSIWQQQPIEKHIYH